MGILLSVFYWPVILLGPLIGNLIDKFGKILFLLKIFKEREMNY